MRPTIEAIFVKSSPEVGPGVERPDNDGGKDGSVLLDQGFQRARIIQVGYGVNIEVIVTIQVLEKEIQFRICLSISNFTQTLIGRKLI